MTVREFGTSDRISSTWDLTGENPPRWAVHIIVDVPSLDDALRTAEQLATSLAFLPQVDPGETTVSAEDHQSKRYRVFCDRALPDRSRCTGADGHDGPCAAGAKGAD